MNATKRKFNALLQGIGARPPTPVSAADKKTASAHGDSTSIGTSVYKVNNKNRSSDLVPDSFVDRSRPGTSSATGDADMLVTTFSSDVDALNKRRRIGGLPPSSTSPAALKDTSGNVGTTISNIVLRKFSGSGNQTSQISHSQSHAPYSYYGGSTYVKPRDDRNNGNSNSNGNGNSSSYSHNSNSAPQVLPPPPRYCPGDRDQLVKRLATFQELTDWTPKPDRVGEIEWAKRGWVCQGKERLRCTLCNKEIVVKLNKREVDGHEVPVLVSSEFEAALVDRYVDLIGS